MRCDQFRILTVVPFVAAALITMNTASAQEPVVLRGHNGAVVMAAFAADNERVVTASSDQTAKLWDVSTGAELQSWNQHTGPLYCLAVSADGRTLVTGAQDNTLRVWDLPLSRPLRRAHEPGSQIRDFTFSPDGQMLLSGGDDRTVRLVSLAQVDQAVAEAAALVVRKGHPATVSATAYRSDGVCFASADSTGRITIWSPDLETPLGRLQSYSGNVSSLAFTANNQQLLSAGDDGVVRSWQLMPSLPKLVSTADSAGLTLAVVAGQPLSIFADSSGKCRLIQLQTGEVVREFSASVSQLTDVALAPNNSVVLMSTSDGLSSLVNFNDGASLGTVGGHEGAITDSAIHPDAQRFVTGGKDGTVRVWKPPVAAITLPGHTAQIRGVASAATGLWTATIADDMTTRLWNSTGGAQLQLGNHTQPLRAIAIRDDDALLATGDEEGIVWIWNPSSGAAEGVVPAHHGGITAIAFSADRSSLITAGADGTVRSWSLPLPKQRPAVGEETAKPVWEFRSPDNQVVTQLVRVSPDEGLLALTAGGSQILRLDWDGSARTPLNSPEGVLRRLDIGSTGSSFLATSEAGHVYVFAADGTLQKIIPPMTGLTSARLDREGKLLIVCDGQPRVQIISVDTGRVHEELLASSPVTDADWLAADQRSIVAIGDGKEPVLMQSSMLRIWEDLPTGGTVLAFTPDQQHLLAGRTDGVICQWQLSDGRLVRTFEGHSGAVAELQVSPNGQNVCAVSQDKTLRIWKADDSTRMQTLEHPQPVRSLSIASDSSRVATACADGLVRVWDIVTGQLLESFSEHAAGTAVNCVRYVNDSLTLISTGDDKTLQTAKTSVIRSLPIHKGAIRSMASYGGGGQVVTAGVDGQVILTNINNGNKERLYETGAQKATSVAVRADNQRIAAGCESGEVLIWNAGNGEQTLQTLHLTSAVDGITWSPDNRKLAVSTADNVVRVFGPTVPGVQQPDELVLHQQFSTEAPVTKLLFSLDNRFLWTSLANGRLDEWVYAAPEQRRQFNHGGPVYGVSVSRDGSVVVSCSTDQTVRVWDTVTGQQKFQLNGHQGAVHAVAISPDETFAVSSGADGTMRLWDIVGGRQLKQLTTFDATMYSVAIHPGGSLIAAAGADRKVHLLDMISGIEQQTLTGHSDYIHCVTFRPGGEQILSYGYAGQLKLWNTADGRLLQESQVGRIGNYAQFAPDGQHVVLANGDGTARVQQVP
jgi:WD40 repeat protein